MKRKRVWQAASVIVAIGIVAGITQFPSIQRTLHPPVLSILSDDEVTELRASLCESKGGIGDDKPLPEFVVPEKHVPLILHWLRPAKYESRPPIFPESDELGEVVIKNRSGEEMRLRFFFAGHNPVVFTPDGVNYFYGWNDGIDRSGNNGVEPPPAISGGIELMLAIKEAFKASKLAP